MHNSSWEKIGGKLREALNFDGKLCSKEYRENSPFAPLGLGHILLLPMACALSFILVPLCGFNRGLLLRHLRISELSRTFIKPPWHLTLQTETRIYCSLLSEGTL